MRSAVRLTAAGHSASGVLTSLGLIGASLRAHFERSACEPMVQQATHVITAAHFARRASSAAVSSSLVNTVARDFRIVPGTDIAVGRLSVPAPLCQLLPITPGFPLPGTRLLSVGFSGLSHVPGEELVPRLVFSRVLSGMPWIFSYDLRTRARYGALLLPTGLQWSRRGDSGGPVLRDGALVGIQSMVAMPFGFPIGIAGVNLLAPHLPALRAAIVETS